MPPLPGEVSLLTIFADIHYYFSHPAAKPVHHRFDKTSYVYLFQNPMQQRGRLEVANHPGTPEQDAFNGYLDSVRVERSHKHPLLFTITIDGNASQGSASSTPSQDISQWHIPTHDPRNEAKYMYKIHSIDLYLWTESDANLLLDSLKRVLHEGQLRILDAPPTPIEHRDTMSPVVQKLEQAAIAKPYVGRSDSISTTQSMSFPGPPQSAPPSSGAPGHAAAENSPGYKPMAYNPAAPAAPEPIAHREKTPPPPDAETGTGLASAAVHDHGHQTYGGPPQTAFTPQPTGAAQQPYIPGPPQGTPPVVHRTNTGSSFPPPPPPSGSAGPPAGQQYAQSFAPPPTSAPTTAAQPQYASQPTTQYANYPGSPGHAPVQSPGFPPTPGLPQSPGHPPQQSYAPLKSPGLPPGGYSQYNYAQQQQQQQPPYQPHDTYNIHSQVYRPTEVEAHSHVKPANPNAPPSRVDKIEKGVGRLLKKLDKKF